MDEVPLLLLLLVLSGFFSGAEIALFSLGQEKIQALKKAAQTPKERKSATRLEELKADQNTLLVTILIGNNFVNVLASSLATLLAQGFAKENLGLSASSSMVIATVVGIMTLLILFFGEIIPKSVAHRHALKFSLFSAPILLTIQFLLYPLIWPMTWLVKKFSGGEELKHGMDESELKAAIELSEKEGKIESEEKELVKKVLEFDTHTVETVMTPRSKIFSLPGEMTIMKSLPKITESGFSRTPIYQESTDNVVGIATVHLLLEGMQKGDIQDKTLSSLKLHEVLRIPTSMKLDSLLKEFQTQKTHVAIVQDEHGGVVGLITLEDILEEIFGEFLDENDEEFSIRRISKNKFLVDGEVELENLEKTFHEKFVLKRETQMPWELTDENKTLAGFLLEKFEKFPKEEEHITVQNDEVKFLFIIKKFEDNLIKKVEVLVR